MTYWRSSTAAGTAVCGGSATSSGHHVFWVSYYVCQAAVMAAAAASVAFVDTYRQTGSARAGVRAMGESFANSMSMGGYGMVQAISNDEAGHYLANYAANLATVGIYGTVRAFHDGQYGAGILGVIQIAALAYGAYSAYQANSATVSGSEPAQATTPADSGASGQLASAEGSNPTIAQDVGQTTRTSVLDFEASAGAEGWEMQAHVDVNGPVATMVFPKGSEPASGTLVVFDKYGGGELPFDVSLGEPAALKVTGLSRLELNQPRTVGVTVTMKSGSVRILSVATDTRAAVTPGGPIAAR